MKLPIYQVDAFASQRFRGNPAAVVPVTEPLSASLMQSIALENNLSETAFVHGSDGTYSIRWFTPTTEVALCGHATLASAFIVFQHLEPSLESVSFTSASGPLSVTRDRRRLTLNFPAIHVPESTTSPELEKALGVVPSQVYEDDADHVVFLESESDVLDVKPDFEALRALGKSIGAIVTAPGDNVDYVCRYFAPGSGVNEDPVTGSAQCRLAPLWAQHLGTSEFVCRQVSTRGGELHVRLAGDRVLIGGECVQYLVGEIELD